MLVITKCYRWNMFAVIVYVVINFNSASSSLSYSFLHEASLTQLFASNAFSCLPAYGCKFGH